MFGAQEQSLLEEVTRLRKIVSDIKQISDAKAEACAVLLGALSDAQEALAQPNLMAGFNGTDALPPALGSGLRSPYRIPVQQDML